MFSILDPCSKIKCGASRECIPTEDGKARCQCIKSCPNAEEEGLRSVKIHIEKLGAC